MRTSILSLVSMLLLSAPAIADEGRCKVTISGAFKGSVPCRVTFAAVGDEYHLGIGAGATGKPVTANLLADFREAPRPGAYGFDALARVSGSASAQERQGLVWALAKGGPSRIAGTPPVLRQGKVVLKLTATGRRPGDFHGRAILTLVPTNAVGKADAVPVRVEIEF